MEVAYQLSIGVPKFKIRKKATTISEGEISRASLLNMQDRKHRKEIQNPFGCEA
jgi:hypothetical protein